jgi:hypothetical protein
MSAGALVSPSLGVRPGLPVWIRWVEDQPKILAGGVLVAPLKTALRRRARHDGVTRKSPAVYAHAGALYTTYCAHQRIGLLDVTNDECRTILMRDRAIFMHIASGGTGDNCTEPIRLACSQPEQR